MPTWKDKYEHYTRAADNFPWQWFGGVPTIGPTHTYLLRILIGNVSGNFRTFALGAPSFGELTRMCDDMRRQLRESDSQIMDIFKYCNGLEEKYSHERKSRRVEVFEYLKNNSGFLRDFEKMVKTKEGVCPYS